MFLKGFFDKAKKKAKISDRSSESSDKSTAKSKTNPDPLAEVPVAESSAAEVPTVEEHLEEVFVEAQGEKPENASEQLAKNADEGESDEETPSFDALARDRDSDDETVDANVESSDAQHADDSVDGDTKVEMAQLTPVEEKEFDQNFETDNSQNVPQPEEESEGNAGQEQDNPDSECENESKASYQSPVDLNPMPLFGNSCSNNPAEDEDDDFQTVVEYKQGPEESVYESAVGDNDSDTESTASTVVPEDEIDQPEPPVEGVKPNWYYKKGIFFTRFEPELVDIYRDDNEPLNWETFKRIVQFCRSAPPEHPTVDAEHMDSKAAKMYYHRRRAEDGWFRRYKRDQLDEETQLRLYGTLKPRKSKEERKKNRERMEKIHHPPPPSDKLLTHAKDGKPVKWVGPGGLNAKGEPKIAYVQINHQRTAIQPDPHSYDEKGYRIVFDDNIAVPMKQRRRIIFKNDKEFQIWLERRNKIELEMQISIDARNNLKRSRVPNTSLNISSTCATPANAANTLNQMSYDSRLNESHASTPSIASINASFGSTTDIDPMPILTIAGELGEINPINHICNYSQKARESRYSMPGLQVLQLDDFKKGYFASVAILTINTDLHFVLVPHNVHSDRLEIEEYLTDVLTHAGDKLQPVNPNRLVPGQIYIVFLESYRRYFRACLQKQESKPIKSNVNINLIDFGQTWHADTTKFYKLNDHCHKVNTIPPTTITAEIQFPNGETSILATPRYTSALRENGGDHQDAITRLRQLLADRGAWCKTVGPSHDHLRLICNLRVCPENEHRPERAVDIASWLMREETTPALPLSRMLSPPEVPARPNQRYNAQPRQAAPMIMPDLGLAHMPPPGYNMHGTYAQMSYQQHHNMMPPPNMGMPPPNFNNQPGSQEFIPNPHYCGPPQRHY